MASFSRLQLAAALLEYDNDPDDPTAPHRSAHDSAIFAHLRKANGNIHATDAGRRSTDYLGVTIPSESGMSNDKEKTRRSKSSVDMLHNPFGEDEEEEPEEEPLEVDLASWGLDSFMPKEKGRNSKNSKGKAKSEILQNTHKSSIGVGPRPGGGRMTHSRTMSMPMGDFGAEVAFLDSQAGGKRRASLSDLLNTTEINGETERPINRQRFSTHPVIEGLPVRPPLLSATSFGDRDTIPFPSSSPIPEQSEMSDGEGSRTASRLGSLATGRVHERTYSSATMGTTMKLERPESPNLFAIPPPPMSRASRFDPKTVAHVRTMSNATRLSVAQSQAYNESEVGPRAPSRASVLDPRAPRDRRLSTTSFGTRNMLDDDLQSAYGGFEDYPSQERRYSRLDLMRPKVLIMPSPLQNNQPPPAQSKLTREGFLDSSDGRPLPPGAKSSSRLSVFDPSSSTNAPVASNSFTPNPRLSLSTSQLLFRNTLVVDGQRDVTYNDIDGNLPRAVMDGEQAEMDYPEEPEETQPTAPTPTLPVETAKPRRPPGKLFGRSLIDDLESRKAEMRNKQRVFTGDQRPSMMDRPGMKRSSTLIDPASLQRRPSGRRLESAQTDTGLTRRGSRSGQPLLTFDEHGKLEETGTRESKIPNTRSVFGVDTLWEREMEKLKEIEAQEVIEEERKKREEQEQDELKAKKRKKRKGQNKQEEVEKTEQVSPLSSAEKDNAPRRQSLLPMSLPDIPKVTSRRIVPMPADDESDESSASEAAPRVSTSTVLRDEAADKWVSDDERQPARTTGVGPRYPPPLPNARADDSDEDVPLSVALKRATWKLSALRAHSDDDSDEDKPLSTLVDRTKSSIPPINFDNLNPSPSGHPNKKLNADDEDDVPLGIRMSHLPSGSHSQFSGLSGISQAGANDDDDDRPLAMHPEQIRKSQFMFAQAQHQQQQQMFQAQMYNSMAFAPQPSMMLMMPPPAPVIAPMPMQLQDTNKYGRVDRWRHDVAVEGHS